MKRHPCEPPRTPPPTAEELMATLDRERLPRHVAIIMDGNGRWAQERSLPGDLLTDEPIVTSSS